MTVSTLILRASRAAHKIAVKAHCKALRLSVTVADAKADRHIREASRIMDTALVLNKMHRDAVDKSVASHNYAYGVRLAAQTEANNIGGTL